MARFVNSEKRAKIRELAKQYQNEVGEDKPKAIRYTNKVVYVNHDKNRLMKLIEDFEADLDDNVFEDWHSKISLKNRLGEFEKFPKIEGMAFLRDLEARIEELKLIGKDPQVTEAYSDFSKDQIRMRLAHYQTWVNAISPLCKITRRRKKRTQSVERQTKAVQTATKAIAGVIPVDPKNIIGKKFLVTYNDKYKYLSLLIAGNGGFAIKGKTIQNIDESQSVRKRIANANSVIKAINNSINGAGIINCINQVSSNGMPVTGRLSEDVALIKVM